jgi:hypothetical protein
MTSNSYGPKGSQSLLDFLNLKANQNEGPLRRMRINYPGLPKASVGGLSFVGNDVLSSGASVAILEDTLRRKKGVIFGGKKLLAVISLFLCT